MAMLNFCLQNGTTAAMAISRRPRSQLQAGRDSTTSETQVTEMLSIIVKTMSSKEVISRLATRRKLQMKKLNTAPEFIVSNQLGNLEDTRLDIVKKETLNNGLVEAVRPQIKVGCLKELDTHAYVHNALQASYTRWWLHHNSNNVPPGDGP